VLSRIPTMMTGGIVAGLLVSCAGRSSEPVAVAQPAPEATYTRVEYLDEPTPDGDSTADRSTVADDGSTDEAQAERAQFERVFFAFDSASLADLTAPILEHNADIMLEYPELRIEVRGHADPRGPAAYNLDLSQRRADAVVAALASRGVDADRIEAVGYGERDRLADGTDPRAYARDRRIEIVLTADPDKVARGTRGTEIESTDRLVLADQRS